MAGIAVHFIEKLDAQSKVVGSTGEWESGNWAVSKAAANRLTDEGGSLYLHTARAEPSHWGGKIVGHRFIEGGESDGRVVFRFIPARDHKDVLTDASGWGQEKKYVGFGDATGEA